MFGTWYALHLPDGGELPIPGIWCFWCHEGSDSGNPAEEDGAAFAQAGPVDEQANFAEGNLSAYLEDQPSAGDTPDEGSSAVAQEGESGAAADSSTDGTRPPEDGETTWRPDTPPPDQPAVSGRPKPPPPPNQPLYRVLRPDEDPAAGLQPKDPSAKEPVWRHIRFGSKSWFKSQFISTTKDLAVAARWANRTGNRVAVIDASLVNGNIIDVSTKEALAQQGITWPSLAYSFALSSQEVLVEGNIPSGAILVVLPPSW